MLSHASPKAPSQHAGERLLAVVVACASAPFLFAALAGLTAFSLRFSLVLAGLLAAVVGRALWHRPSGIVEWSGCPRVFAGIGVAAAIAAILLVSRLTVFMVDPARTSWSAFPSSAFERQHLCLTAYYVAGDVVRDHPNVYEPSLYDVPGSDPSLPRKAQMLGPFRVDQYEYPPPFLLMPRALAHVAPGLLRLRALWFGMTGLAVIGALLMTGRSLEGTRAARALLLAPFVLASPATLSALQKCNVQLAVIAVSLIAMTLVARRHHATGGALLSFVTVAKLYPALLVLYLIARRQWRAVIWIACFAVVFLVLTVADMGWGPFVSFRSHLPGLMGGEAFPAFRNPATLAVNLSIPGFVFKARLFQIPGMGFPAMHVVGTAYMFVAAATTVALGLRTRPGTDAAIVWLTILVLATLRSPFLPFGYGTFPALWLATLMAARADGRAVPAWLAAIVILGVLIPSDVGLDPRVMAAITTIPQVVMIAVALLATRQSVFPVAGDRVWPGGQSLPAGAASTA